MKKVSKILWGIVIILAGVAVALDILGIIDINYSLLLDGWWTLFIIVPSLISLIANGPRTGNIIMLCVGLLLLLGTRDIIGFDVAAKLVIPAIIVAVGVGMIVKAIKKPKTGEKYNKKINASKPEDDYTATFAGQTVSFGGEVLKSFSVNAIFGGVKCDLRGAKLDRNIIIEASSIFGGIDFFIPEDMPVKIKSTSIFGGVNNKRGDSISSDETPTIYIKSTCVFGGIDVK